MSLYVYVPRYVHCVSIHYPSFSLNAYLYFLYVYTLCTYTLGLYSHTLPVNVCTIRTICLV